MRLHFSAHSERQPDAVIKSFSAEQTYKIGQALSKLALLKVRNELATDGGILRIGIIARPRAGKSILFEGVMGPLLAPINLDNRPRMSLLS